MSYKIRKIKITKKSTNNLKIDKYLKKKIKNEEIHNIFTNRSMINYDLTCFYKLK